MSAQRAVVSLFKQLTRTVNANSSTILTVAGVTGTIATAYLAAKASFQAAKDIQEAEPQPETLREKVDLVWPRYIPAGVTGAVTVVSIIGSDRISNKRTAAAVTAYTLGERAFSEYREKVVDQFGANKERNIRDQIAQDIVMKSSPAPEMVVINPGEVLCCELLTRRYFMSSMETLMRSQNEINATVVNNLYATLSDFYYMIGIGQTTHSGEIGWDSDRLMDLEFSTVLTEDGRPCLAFTYNYTKPI